MENKQTPAPEQAPEIKEGFFLRRPIFSTVISLIITLVGAIAISVLPVEQYPDLATQPEVDSDTYNVTATNDIAENLQSQHEMHVNDDDNMLKPIKLHTSDAGHTENRNIKVTQVP